MATANANQCKPVRTNGIIKETNGMKRLKETKTNFLFSGPFKIRNLSLCVQIKFHQLQQNPFNLKVFPTKHTERFRIQFVESSCPVQMWQWISEPFSNSLSDSFSKSFSESLPELLSESFSESFS